MKDKHNSISKFLKPAVASSALVLAISTAAVITAQGQDDPDQGSAEVIQQIEMSTEAPIRTGPLGGYADIVERVSPSVVSISTERVERGYQRNPYNGRLQMREFSEPAGLGSGVVVTSDGIIVTNNHVIDGASAVQVHLQGRKLPITAQVLGVDESTDLAVLKVDETGLPAATFAESTTVKPGDIVLAIGSPFGLTQSVTSGIVSALGRSNLGIVARGDGYEDFIQTDASINPGNSGGALIDNRGRVIGINTAILSRSGGSVGIGLAIPTDLVVDVVDQIVETGEIRRGFVGIGMADTDAALTEQLDLKASGVLVTQVVRDSPAFAAGLEPGDVIVKLNDKSIPDASRLRLEIGRERPGETLSFAVNRGGKELEMEVTTTERQVVWQKMNNNRRNRMGR